MKPLTIIDEEALVYSKNSDFGISPNERPIDEYIKNGFFILDKPSGPTSHEIVATIKKILGLNKAGHSGTLDPKVTGVLPIALENATKVLTTLVGAEKSYICNLVVNDSSIPDSTLFPVIRSFENIVYQVPPLKSNVVRKLRKREIFKLDILERQGREILLKVDCEAGTYIRTLCVDIGRALGVGGYMKELRRVRTEPFDETETIILHDLFEAFQDYKDGFGEEKLRVVIKPMEAAVEHIPKVIVKDNAVDPVCHGTKLGIPGILAYSDFGQDELVAIVTGKGQLVAISNAIVPSTNIESQNHGFILQPSRVLMARGTYPKYQA